METIEKQNEQKKKSILKGTYLTYIKGDTTVMWCCDAAPHL